MIINYETDKINNALHDFYNSTGITIDLLKADFSSVSKASYEFNNYCKCIQSTSAGKKTCHMSDIYLLKKSQQSKKTEMHVCQAGLVDVSVPIIYNEEIIGYIIFGQMKITDDFASQKDYIRNLNLDISEMENYYNLIPLYDTEKVHSISNIASMLIKYILLENMLKPDLNESIQKAVSFINDNIAEELSIKYISKSINVSKSVLYKKFHDHFSCTVSEYINKRRIEKSIDLLKNTDLSIEDISQKVGYSNASYYSKIFKRLNGVSPLKYKKNVK